MRPNMHAQTRLPMQIAASIALVGIALIAFSDFNGDAGSQPSSKARAITAAAVSRAGAIETPSEPPAGRKISWATDFTNGNPASLN
jgi:hypothetical protein